MASVMRYILVCKRKIFLTILMPSVIFVYFSQLIDMRNIGIHLLTLLNTLESSDK